MSIYRMISKGIEFDAEAAFQAAANAKQAANAAGLIEVIRDADRKLVFVTGDEADIEEIDSERFRLAQALGRLAYDYVKLDNSSDRAYAHIDEAVRSIIRDASKSAPPPSPRR